jgi:hypothetical protein
MTLQIYEAKADLYTPEKQAGKVFTTQSNSHYSISQAGAFMGRPSIEGAKVKFVAGIDDDPFLIRYFKRCLDVSAPQLRDRLDELILRHGKEPKEGLVLVASLTSEAAQEKGRHGIITTPVQRIERIDA